MMKADVDAATQKIVRDQSEQTYAKYKYQLLENMAAQNAAPVEEVHQWNARTEEAAASVKVSTADAERARLRYESNIGGVNTTVAKATAEVEQSKAALKQALAIADSTKAQLELQRYNRNAC